MLFRDQHLASDRLRWLSFRHVLPVESFLSSYAHTRELLGVAVSGVGVVGSCMLARGNNSTRCMAGFSSVPSYSFMHSV